MLGRITARGDRSAQALSRAGTPGASDDTAQVSPQRRMIAVATPPRNDNGYSLQQRTSVPFLAQLIATAAQMPQTRERRRAEPAEAISSYHAAPCPSTAPNGRLLSRST